VSVQVRSVCILGGTGFVGQAIAQALVPRGVRTRVLTRSEPRAAAVRVLPTVEVMVGDVHEPADLRRAFENMDAVINLIGILHEGRRQSFARCHAELPGKVAQACHATGVQHLLHMSALGAEADAPSAYLRSKWQGEHAVRERSGVTAFTVFRPSVIFGEGDRFLNLFARLSRRAPFVPLASPDARFQPIWVEDVARCFAIALGNARCFGGSYELGGPATYTLEELARYAMRTAGRERRVLRLGPGLASLQAAVFERLPGKLVTRDNLRSMTRPNTCAGPFPTVFGFKPTAMEAVAPAWLAEQGSRARYNRYRHAAGR
jgi:NADH dehydrogenase